MAWASIFAGALGGLGQGLGDYFSQKNQFDWNTQYQQQAYQNNLALQNAGWASKTQYQQLMLEQQQKNWTDQTILKSQLSGISTPSSLLRQHASNGGNVPAGLRSTSTGTGTGSGGIVSSSEWTTTPGGNLMKRSPSFSKAAYFDPREAAIPGRWAGISGASNVSSQASFNLDPHDMSVGTSDPAITDDELGTNLLQTGGEATSAQNYNVGAKNKYLEGQPSSTSDDNIPNLDETALHKAQMARNAPETKATGIPAMDSSETTPLLKATPSSPDKSQYEAI